MIKTLYLVWHGQTLFARQGRCEGWSDSPLSDEACERARATGRDFFAVGAIAPDALFSSMSERACDTLELICREAYGTVAPYERLKGLKDLNYGIYEAKDRCLVPPVPYGDFFVKFGGESDGQLAARMREAVVSIARRPDVGSAIVSTHRIACARLCGLWDERSEAWCLAAPDCSVVVLACDATTGAMRVTERFTPRGQA